MLAAVSLTLAAVATAAGASLSFSQDFLTSPAQTGVAPPPVAKPVAPRAFKAVPPTPGVIGAKGCGSPGALGVSRIQEIDTSTGPRLGHQQYKDIDFLGDHEVVLTFDDGPLRPYTTPVLKALEAHCTRATFVGVGRLAVSDPALVRETEKEEEAGA